MGRQRSAAVVAGIAVIAAGAGWFAGSRISSPDEARSKAKAPTASLITAPVETRSLSSNIVLRGDLAFEESTPISLGSESGSTSVVTKSPPPVGSQLAEGDVLFEVSGRPLIILQGDLPVFRTLAVGVSGDDVVQLESALSRLGFDPGPIDSAFDGATQFAVSAMYRQLGYTTKEPTKELKDSFESAQSAANSARDALRVERKAVDDAAKPIKESERLSLQNAVVEADAALAQARKAVERGAAEGLVLVAAAEEEVNQAVSARDVAASKLAEAQAPGAIDPLTSAPYAASALAELASAVRAADAQIAAKRSGVVAARNSATDSGAEKAGAVAAAQRGLELATASRNEGLFPTPTGDAASGLAQSLRSVADAEQRLAEAAAAVGVTVPAGEIVFLKALPRRIDATYLKRGDTASGQVVDVSGADLNIKTSISPADRSLVSVGSEVQITEDNLDIKLKGVVSRVADQPGSNGAGESGGEKGSGGTGGSGATGGNGSATAERYEVVVTPGELPTDVNVADLQGVNFKLTIPVKSTEGAVLAVPVAALSATPDGGTRVEVLVSGRKTRFVTVKKGLAAQGYVEVSASARDALSAGDQVVVGK